MSHSKERAEKICLNCNASLYGRFCHVCGQENIEPKETAWGLISHFFYDITHFDGKFFRTVGLLVRKPGFLSKEYKSGRRASYLGPVRMYVFTSALFFILFFSFFFNVKSLVTGEPEILKKDSATSKGYGYDNYALATAKTKDDSARIMKGLEEAHKLTDSLSNILSDKSAGSKGNKRGIRFSYDTTEYASVGQYDSVQNLLPVSERDGWLLRRIKRKQIELDPEYKKDRMVFFRKWADTFIHYFPQILFLSLPLIALVLQILYIRRRKQFYYVSHGIFLIHIYIYSFINLLVLFSLNWIKGALGWEWLWWLQLGLFIHAIWYVYKAMRNFYGQGRFKTLMKFFLLNLFTYIIIVLLFSVFILVSAWNL